MRVNLRAHLYVIRTVNLVNLQLRSSQTWNQNVSSLRTALKISLTEKHICCGFISNPDHWRCSSVKILLETPHIRSKTWCQKERGPVGVRRTNGGVCSDSAHWNANPALQSKQRPAASYGARMDRKTHYQITTKVPKSERNNPLSTSTLSEKQINMKTAQWNALRTHPSDSEVGINMVPIRTTIIQ